MASPPGSIDVGEVQAVEHADDLSSDESSAPESAAPVIIPDFASDMLEHGISPVQATIELLARIRRTFPLDAKTKKFVQALETQFRIGGSNLFMPQGAETMFKGLFDSTDKAARRAGRRHRKLMMSQTI